MTINEFKRTRFYSGMRVRHKGYVGVTFRLQSVDLAEYLVGVPAAEVFTGGEYGKNDVVWFRCEHCTIIHPNAKRLPPWRLWLNGIGRLFRTRPSAGLATT